MATERFGIFNIPLSVDGEDESDFKQVPASDKGNSSYSDRGQLGSFATNGGEPFEAPRDIKFFAGYGADETDLDRGYVEPTIRDLPNYNMQDYKQRSTYPMKSNDDMGETDAMRDDWEFRRKNTRSKGFLTRPNLPTERN
jgi:hypothetical protein